MKDKQWIAIVVLIIIIAVVAYNSRQCEVDDVEQKKVILKVDDDPVLKVNFSDTLLLLNVQKD